MALERLVCCFFYSRKKSPRYWHTHQKQTKLTFGRMIVFQFFPIKNPQISELYKANYPTLAEKGCPFLHTFTPSAVYRSVGVSNCWKSPLACAGVSRTCNQDPKNRKSCVSFSELTTVEFRFSAKHTADAFRKKWRQNKTSLLYKVSSLSSESTRWAPTSYK